MEAMADVLTKAQRSYNMSRIRGRDTGPETAVRRGLRLVGLRDYRIKSALLGRPDIVFPAKRLAVFIDGFFWHGCPVHYHPPATRARFWARKIERNKARDGVVNRYLEEAGWQVVRFWEHEVKEHPGRVVSEIKSRTARGELRLSESRT